MHSDNLTKEADFTTLGRKLKCSMCKPCEINLIGCSIGSNPGLLTALAKESGCTVRAAGKDTYVGFGGGFQWPDHSVNTNPTWYWQLSHPTKKAIGVYYWLTANAWNRNPSSNDSIITASPDCSVNERKGAQQGATVW